MNKHPLHHIFVRKITAYFQKIKNKNWQNSKYELVGDKPWMAGHTDTASVEEAIVSHDIKRIQHLQPALRRCPYWKKTSATITAITSTMSAEPHTHTETQASKSGGGIAS